MRITLAYRDRSFEAAPDQSLLDAALDASLNLPHSCKGGSCGACRARLLQGEIHYPNGPPLGLSESEIRDGLMLMCQARARSDLTLETFEIAAPEDIVTKRLPARIDRIEPLSHDVMGVHLRLPAAEEFRFKAGQYLDIMLSGGRRRSFSIASPPHEARTLELHVRRVAGGEFSERLFRDGAEGSLLSIEGPLGQFLYRDAPAGRPMLMVGGGTGLAPLLCIIKHVLHERLERDMRLYWGVRAERDLYADQALLDLERRMAQTAGARLTYVPVLSEGSVEWRGARGLVHAAVLADFSDFAGCDVYTAGPPAMVAAVRRELAARGTDAERIFFDSFDYAPDSAARQSINAASKD
jgi:CDP-4-dehydro-6-deoxyglucose reductase